ncbi:hypothetical protein [Wohlfahrtiimonas chitiniclastica]|uniref:hypothetical protein n=1 Tax=Wohlfahrtiimonas chitiniclastica TaxID=400946 RepID=UPI000BCACDA3|nr:hypothetical protein [Wohlfahrtiimonas chitiniclastica]OYQ85120.1 hypothetical protein B9T14_01175 [Wohlfahrtiimonas chitiniclastica]
MVEKKCWKIAIYGGVTSIIVCSAIIMFLFPDITWGDVKNSALYEMLKDHGSFIGGVLAIMGVIVMVNNQNATTAKVIKSNMDVIHYQSFEDNKSTALLLSFEIEILFNKVFSNLVPFGEQCYMYKDHGEIDEVRLKAVDREFLYLLREKTLFIQDFMSQASACREIDLYLDLLNNFLSFNCLIRDKRKIHVHAPLAYSKLYEATKYLVRLIEDSNDNNGSYLFKNMVNEVDIPKKHSEKQEIWNTYESFIIETVIPRLQMKIKNTKRSVEN